MSHWTQWLARRAFVVAMFFVASNPMNAATTGQNDSKFVDLSVADERVRIGRERDAAQKQFDAADRACDAKFMRTDCVNSAKLSRRVVMDDLRRQEIGLNDRERKIRASEGQTRFDTSRTSRAEADRLAKEQTSKAADAERRSRVAQRAADRAQRAKLGKQNDAQVKERRVKSAADKIANQAKRNAKSPQRVAEQQAREAKYAQRRADLNQRLSTKTQPAAAPLAVPPPPPTPLPARQVSPAVPASGAAAQK